MTEVYAFCEDQRDLADEEVGPLLSSLGDYLGFSPS